MDVFGSSYPICRCRSPYDQWAVAISEDKPTIDDEICWQRSAAIFTASALPGKSNRYLSVSWKERDEKQILSKMYSPRGDIFPPFDLRSAGGPAHDEYQQVATDLTDDKLCLGFDNSGTDVQQQLQLQQLQQQQQQQHISEGLQCLKGRTELTASELQRQQAVQESFTLQYQENARVTHTLQQVMLQAPTPARAHTESRLKMEKQNLEIDLREKAYGLHQARQSLQEKLYSTLQIAKQVLTTILHQQLTNWQVSQIAATYRSDISEGQALNTVQKWCEELLAVLIESRVQIKRSEELQMALPIAMETDQLSDLKALAHGLLATLVNRSLIIDRQPPQVLKKDTRFMASVRLLIGHKQEVLANMPQVEAVILNEQQAKKVMRDGALGGAGNSGEIANSKSVMEPNQGQLSAIFRNMALKKIKRTERKGQELVVEEKFCILFRAGVTIRSCDDLQFDLFALSLPIVVTVHGNQECQAQATILWDNAFSDYCRQPFHVPDSVAWKQLSLTLAHWFVARTGAPLSVSNMDYLAAKLFGQSESSLAGGGGYSACRVTRALFHKDQMHPGRHFTFWEWLYGIQKLTKEYLRPLWCERLIAGFVSKRQAQELLAAKPVGTFLLRFSDSECGGVSICYVAEDSKTGEELGVLHVAPFVDKDLRIRGLADRIKDLPQLCYLYPDTPKERAFGKYWSREDDECRKSASSGSDDYVRTRMINTIPAMSAYGCRRLSDDACASTVP